MPSCDDYLCRENGGPDPCRCAPSDDLPCSGCPILDLGTRYPVKDERDPWRRQPALFAKLVKGYGRGMYSHDGTTRLRVESKLGHYCKTTREKHGPCTAARAALCQRALNEAVDWAVRADEPHAALQVVITRLITNDGHHEALKATRVGPPTPTMSVPPITLMKLPADV